MVGSCGITRAHQLLKYGERDPALYQLARMPSETNKSSSRAWLAVGLGLGLLDKESTLEELWHAEGIEGLLTEGRRMPAMVHEPSRGRIQQDCFVQFALGKKRTHLRRPGWL
jgi:hypothetical protein